MRQAAERVIEKEGMSEGIWKKGIRVRDGSAGDSRAEGGWKGLLPDILLMYINGAGIGGALLEALGVEREAVNWPMLWGGWILVCTLSVLWWQGRRRGIIWRTAALCLAYGAGLFWIWKSVINGMWQSLQSQVGGDTELPFEYVGELLGMAIDNSGKAVEVRTLGLLAVSLLPALLAGLCCIKGKWQIFLAGDILWIAVSCYTNLFPGMPCLILCVAGIVLGIARGEFKCGGRVWGQALAGTSVLIFMGIWAGSGLLLPVLDGRYESSAEQRHEFYVTVNHRLLPSLQSLVSDYGVGRGVDVTGTFGRRRYAGRAGAGIYRVTLDKKPGQAMYLRGFVGADYGRRQWEPESVADIERYDREHDMSLAQNAAGLLNIGYRAMENRGQQGQVRIEEMAGRGSYSLLPYGALVTDAYTAHPGGAVDRRGSSYDFQYRQLSGAGGGAVNARWENLEQQYRQYVYDSFLDYPEERLQKLTTVLELEKFPREDPYRCAEEVIRFLERHIRYRLDTPATPLNEDFVEYSLFDSHEGYCAHFASAAVLIFRYCGIPARYATGYSVSPQRFVEAEEGMYSAVLTGAQAHAWAEIYLAGVGWVPVETTPGAAAFGEDNRMELLLRLGELTGDVEIRAAEEVGEGGENEEDDEEDEEDNLSPGLNYDLEDLEDDEEEEEEAQRHITPGGIAASLFFALLLAAAAAFLTALLRRRSWRRKLEETKGREKAFLLYRNMRRALQVLGCSRKLILTEEAFWERLETVLPTQEKKDYDRICAILEQSSFGRREPTREELETLQGLHDEMLRKLYFKASSYRRLAFRGLVCCMPPAFGYGKG